VHRFISVGQHVTWCDPIWQAMLCGWVITKSHRQLLTIMPRYSHPRLANTANWKSERKYFNTNQK